MIGYKFREIGQKDDNETEDINYLLSLLTSRPITVTSQNLNKTCKSSRLLFAQDSETKKVIGMATLALIVIPTGKFGRIEDVVVHDKYRGQGIGKTLTKRLIEEAKRLNLERIDLTSRPSRKEANRLYQDLGFSKVDTNLYRLKLD